MNKLRFYFKLQKSIRGSPCSEQFIIYSDSFGRASAKAVSTSVLKAAIFLEIASNSIVRVVDVVGSGVDTDLLPHKETVRDVIANVSVVNERVVLRVSLLFSPHVSALLVTSMVFVL